MTQIQPQIDSSFNIIPDENIEIRARKISAAGQKQVVADIDRLKAMGEPIHYMLDRKLVREEANGQKFEIELQADGSEKIVCEII